jgi:hypothetical protein
MREAEEDGPSIALEIVSIPSRGSRKEQLKYVLLTRLRSRTKISDALAESVKCIP